MRIYYDGAIYGWYSRRPGGVSNFYDHLISRVSSSYPCLLTSSRPHHLPHPEGRFLSVSRWNNSIRLGRLSNLSRRIKFQASVSLFAPSIIHPTYYVKPFNSVRHLPLVYTAYDMIHEKWE